MRPAISSRGGQRKLWKWSLKLNLNFIQIERIAKDSYTELWNWRFCCKGRIWGAFHSTKIPVWNFGHSHTQWHGTFCLHRPDPSHCAFGYCSCKQDTENWYWGKQFYQNGRGHFGPTHWNERTNQSELPSKVQVWDYFPNISVRPNRTIMVCSIWFLTEIS